MTRKRRRLFAVLFGLGMLALATTLALFAIGDSAAYFKTPTDIKTTHVPPGLHLVIGGLVEKGSVKKDGKTVEFRVTDGENAVPVFFVGMLPDLFREGQGVVVKGKLGTDGVVRADAQDGVLAKHDERYMPSEVVDSLKKSGHWQEGAVTQ